MKHLFTFALVVVVLGHNGAGDHVHVGGSTKTVVMTTTRGGEITFSLRDFDRQLLRWREIQDRSMRYNKVIASLDLAVTNNTPVRLVDSSQQPEVPIHKRTTKPSKTPSTTRRRNV